MIRTNRKTTDLKCLPSNEMIEVLASPNEEKKNLFVSGYVDFTLKQVVLFRGYGVGVSVPFDMFVPDAKYSPDFEQFELIDYGQTVKLGEYEASTRSILYKLDPEYKAFCDSIII